MHVSKRWRAPAIALVTTGIVAASLVGVAEAATVTSAKAGRECSALEGKRIDARKIDLPTRGAVITLAETIPASGQTTDEGGNVVLPLPERCRVVASIAPVDPAAYPITVNVNMPAKWNDKLLQSGGGGYGGSLVTAPGRKGSGYFDPQPYDDPYPLTKGYVTFGSDTGHPQGNVDFLLNDESLRNFGGEELKKSRDLAVHVAKSFYRRAPKAVYFSGESDGGRQAMIVAQRYPRDYDAVIATSPVLSWNALMLASNRLRSSLIDEGWLSADDVGRIADQTREQCDMLDGAADGIVAKYQACTVDASTVLNPQQLRSLNLIREPWQLPFTLANGIRTWPGTGVTGQEDAVADQYFAYPVGTIPPTYPLPAGSAAAVDRGRGALLNFGANWVRWAVAQDGSAEPHNFPIEQYKKRIQYLSSIVDATDPDLSEFARAGGKLILTQPSADNAVSTRMVATYYRSVVKTLGEKRTKQFLRFYVTAGGAHNLSGIGHVDALGTAEDWLTKRQTPPASLVALDQDPATLEVARSLPACQWPAFPRYDGTGSTSYFGNFECTPRSDPLS